MELDNLNLPQTSITALGNFDDTPEETDEQVSQEEVTEENLDDKETSSEEEDITSEPQAEKTDKGEESEEDVSVFIDHYKALKQLDLIQLPESFEFNEDDPEKSLMDAYRTHANMLSNTVRQNLLSDMPKQFQDVVAYGLSGGQEFDQFVKIEKANLELASLDTSNEDHASELINTYYENMPETYRKQMINDLKTDGKLQSEADKIKNELAKRFDDSKKEMQKQAAQQKQQRENEQLEFARQVYDTANGQKWSRQQKQAIVDAIFTKGKNSLASNIGVAYSNPEHVVQLAMIFKNYDPKNGFNLAGLTGSKAQSQVRESLRDAIAGNNKEKKKSGRTHTPSNTSFGKGGITLFE